MPQATDELRAQWPGGDRQASDHLRAKGFTLKKDWTWVLPYKTYVPTQRDISAVQYMVDEWDYGSIASDKDAPDDLYYEQPRMTAYEQYFVGLLSEECAESIKMAVGKTLRFGLDTPGRFGLDNEPDFTFTPRHELHGEVGDILAAIEWGFRAGVLQRSVVYAARDAKLEKLIHGRDNLGRHLAPALPGYPVYGPDGAIWEEDPNAVPPKKLNWFQRQWQRYQHRNDIASFEDFC